MHIDPKKYPLKTKLENFQLKIILLKKQFSRDPFKRKL